MSSSMLEGPSMKAEFVANSCFIVTVSDGRSIVIDPWLTGGAYYGSWYNFPPVPGELAARVRSLTPDWVYVSHLHPDHFDPQTLVSFTEASILIGALGHQHLRRSVSGVGLSNIVELPLDVTADLGDGVQVTILSQFAAASGGYDDEVAYPMDTSVVLRDRDGTLLFHVVDNPMSVRDAAPFLGRFGTPDIAILPYSGA